MTEAIRRTDLGGIPAAGNLPAPKISFELFPPKTDKMEAGLWAAIDRLAPLGPEFVSVTYGAGGTTRERTNLEGEIRIPRFNTQRLSIHSSRFVEKSWTSDQIKPELVVERTALGSSLDKVGDFLLKKAKPH